jgi:diadenosine tetraphosphate (Ap4A) HIT family hydrolase/8-oxo-dGTP pyrophosphatase MutT (NUDIX family)
LEGGPAACSFCPGSLREPQTLTETKHFSVVADRDPLRDGHLLIVPRDHVPCVAAFPADWDAELTGLCAEAQEFLGELYGPTIIYERAGEPTRHAHLHIVPSAVSVRETLLRDRVGEPIDSPDDIRGWYERRGPYLYYRDDQGALVAGVEDAPAGFFHGLVRASSTGGAQAVTQSGADAARDLRTRWMHYRRRYGDTASEVIACFLWRAGSICLFRRSQRVDSAPGRWHLVAGYLPRGADPLEHALTEVSEEAGFDSTQVRLMAQGTPFEIGDPFRGVGWRIHPFLFEVLEGEPRLNWEHDEVAWVHPSEIASYHTLGWLPQVYYSLESLARR